jgi:hypothetical protein
MNSKSKRKGAGPLGVRQAATRTFADEEDKE